MTHDVTAFARLESRPALRCCEGAWSGRRDTVASGCAPLSRLVRPTVI